MRYGAVREPCRACPVRVLTPSLALLAQSALLYFFDRDNVEVLIKVLDGCGAERGRPRRESTVGAAGEAGR